MRVFKFGGASVKDAESVRNISLILQKYRDEDLVIIISAMNKTTNALENLAKSSYEDDRASGSLFKEIKDYHIQIAQALFPNQNHPVFESLDRLFMEMDHLLGTGEKQEFDRYYDQLVPYGELLSTQIISWFLNDAGFQNIWLDARKLVITDNTYRSAKVDWEASRDAIAGKVGPAFSKSNILVTQGFIGGNGSLSTTLGREGSDFSAAIFANILDAREVIVWKDVPGYLNADPRYFDDTVKLDRLSYTETIELAFYGAKIIHPKTIRPLKNKGIPLYVKSFQAPDEAGSVIHTDNSSDTTVPSCIIKEDQVLISISSRDFSFIAEDHLHLIFGLFAKHRCGINLMQNSAISFSVCVDNTPRLNSLITELQNYFSVKYNNDLRLITIRHYDADSIRKLTQNNDILLEQRSRVTVQMVVK